MSEPFKLNQSTVQQPSIAPSLRAMAHTVPPKVTLRFDNHPQSPEPKRDKRGVSLVALALVAVISAGTSKGEVTAKRTDLKPTFVHGQALPKLSENGRAQHWAGKKVVVTIDDSVDKLGPWARGSVQDAFGTWLSSGIQIPDLVFSASKGQKFELKQDGINSVLYREIDIPGHTNDLAVTIAYSDPQTGEIAESDIVINKRHPFAALDKLAKERASSDAKTVSVQGSTTPSSSTITRQASCSGEVAGRCGGKFDLTSVLTHEVGHFYGLSEDYTDHYATMFECTSQCETHKRVLADDDVAAMMEIYRVADPASQSATTNASAAPGCTVTPSLGTNASAIGVGAVIGALSLLLGRRRVR